MKRTKTIPKSLLMGVLFLFLTGCAGDVEKALENARFHLDKAQYAQAITQTRAALVIDPTNNEAKFLLATALLGESFLGTNRTYLDLVAELQEGPAAGESDLQTFTRITPDFSGVNDANLALLEEARDTLISIPAASRTADHYLQLYVARLFEIATAVDLINADNPDVECNAAAANPNNDGIPDDYTPANLNGTDANGQARTDRFDNNLNNAKNDGVNAGFPADFAINELLDSMNADRAAVANLKAYLDAQFGDTGGGVALCVP